MTEMQSLFNTSTSDTLSSRFVPLRTKSIMPQIMEDGYEGECKTLYQHIEELHTSYLQSTENINQDGGSGECVKTKWLHCLLCDGNTSPAEQFLTCREQLHVHLHRSATQRTDILDSL